MSAGKRDCEAVQSPARSDLRPCLRHRTPEGHPGTWIPACAERRPGQRTRPSSCHHERWGPLFRHNGSAGEDW